MEYTGGTVVDYHQHRVEEQLDCEGVLGGISDITHMTVINVTIFWKISKYTPKQQSIFFPIKMK